VKVDQFDLSDVLARGDTQGMALDTAARENVRFLRIAGALACVVAALVVGRLNGWSSGGHDNAGEIAVLWVIVLSVATAVVNAALLLADRVRGHGRGGFSSPSRPSARGR
jgi:hypothetical protein